VRLLIVRDGFSPDRLSAGGFAEYQPIASNRTAEGRGINRRVDIVILGRASREAAMAVAGRDAARALRGTPVVMPRAIPSPNSAPTKTE
jgi:chemotaxis protein MotB